MSTFAAINTFDLAPQSSKQLSLQLAQLTAEQGLAITQVKPFTFFTPDEFGYLYGEFTFQPAAQPTDTAIRTYLELPDEEPETEQQIENMLDNAWTMHIREEIWMYEHTRAVICIYTRQLEG